MNEKSAKSMIKKIERMAGIDKVSMIEKSIQSPFDKAFAIMGNTSALEKALNSFASQQSSFDKALARVGNTSALDKALKSFTSQQLSMNSALATIGRFAAIDDSMHSFASQQSTIEKAIQAFTGASHSIINEPNCISAMAESIADIKDYEHVSSDEKNKLIEKFDESSQILSEAKNSQSFIDTFKKLPAILQIILFYIFLNIVIPQLNSISANLLTPVVKSYLIDNVSPNRVKIKGIQRLPLVLDDISTNDLRFIKGDVVHLREEPSTRSTILDEMTFGQIVTVLSKERNWIEIMYEYEDGEILYGWVYTRYTAKFFR